MTREFLKALAKSAREERDRRNNAIYISIRVCELGVKIYAEVMSYCDSHRFTWDDVETFSPELAEEYVRNVVDRLVFHYNSNKLLEPV